MRFGAAPDGLSTAALAAVAAPFGVALSTEAIAGLAGFVRLFLAWNRSINLASLRSDEELVSRHLADSFALAGLVTGDVRRAVDVGSGGGLPAVPLALLLPGTAFELFEPNRKKAAFIRTAVRELALTKRVQVETTAVETPPDPALAGKFDLALSRATMAPPSWLALGFQLVRPGGQVAVFAAGASDAALPSPEAARPYGEGRRLLLYRR